MLKEKKADRALTVFWLVILLVYAVGILNINFSGDPLYYCSDMYTDMLYAEQAWLHKSIFPEGWVYGNQLYAAATPVLAAVFFGITQDHILSMAIASSLMAVGVMVSFAWMIRPVFSRAHEGLAAAAAFLTIVLYCGGPIEYFNGWQLFFTMCTYYACYAITAFLAFGCYLRRNREWTAGFKGLLVLVCLLSFCMGIQSLRQTAVMVLPMLALVVLEWIYCLLTKKSRPVRSVLMVGVFAAANLGGLICGKLVNVRKNEIFGSFRFALQGNLWDELVSCLHTCFSIFSLNTLILMGAAAVFLLTCIWLVFMVLRKRELHEDPLFLYLLLCVISTMAIFAIDFLTTMEVRQIYYFMLFPMYAVVFAGIYSRIPVSKYLLTAGLTVVFAACCVWHGDALFRPAEESSLEAVGACLEEEGISTLFAGWNVGEKVAIASDFGIEVGFWGTEEQVFRSVRYLCNPEVFDAKPEDCAYLVRGGAELAAMEAAMEERITELQLLRYFPELDYYLFTSDTMLME